MTAVREKLPVIAIVASNREWGAEKKNQIDYYDNRFVGANLDNPDFAQIARDMGAEGFRVEDPKEVKQAVEAAVACGKPVVIERPDSPTAKAFVELAQKIVETIGSISAASS